MVESTTERQGRGNTRENRAENRELGGGRRADGGETRDTSWTTTGTRK